MAEPAEATQQTPPSLTVHTTEGKKVTVKAITIGPDKDFGQESGRSNVEVEDPTLSDYVRKGVVIDPPFDPLTLTSIAEASTILEQCIAAMEINIDGFGHRFVKRVNIDSEKCPPGLKRDVIAEGYALENMFAHCCVGYSFIEYRRRRRRDLELTGNSYTELVLGTNGMVDQLVHIPSYQMRLTPQDKESTKYKQKRVVRKPDGSIGLGEATLYKRFRRYVQFSRLGTTGTPTPVLTEPTWFKEWGDPRAISKKTGEVMTPAEVKKSPRDVATPIYHHRIFAGRSPYGIPRYVGNLITLFGDREADNVNYTTLACNNIPSMILAVSNGTLTKGSIERIQQFVQEQIAASKNRTRFLLIEAENPYEQEGDSSLTGGAPKLDVHKLTNDQIADQLFQKFGENNRKKVRQSFRLPSLYDGTTDNYNKSTAREARKLADEQVFAPERAEEDSWFNRELLPALGILYHRMRTLGPNVTDDEDLLKLLLAAEKTGGMTPRIARIIIVDIMGQEFPEAWKDLDPDVPFTLQLAERMKNASSPGSNLGPAGVDTTQSQASSALKDEDGMDDPSRFLDRLLNFREVMEAEIERRASKESHEGD